MKPSKGFAPIRNPKSKLKKLETASLEQETHEMERKLADMKVFMKSERDKNFFAGTKDRFNASDRGPIRNYGQHIVNKHLGKDPINGETPKKPQKILSANANNKNNQINETYNDHLENSEFDNSQISDSTTNTGTVKLWNGR